MADIDNDTLEGPAGSATPAVGAPDATVAAWFLTCPGQSPAWDKYALGIVHLREQDGVQQAKITTPGATHEVLLIALDPDTNPTAHAATWHHLRPCNVVEQVQLTDDQGAVELLELCARSVVDGLLWAEPPLSGQVEPWRTTLIRTSAHLRGEPHASGDHHHCIDHPGEEPPR